MSSPEIVAFLRRAGLVGPAEEPRFKPLTGGVASDIWRVEAGGRAFVVKRALEKLRVAQEWCVPTSRNASEVAWLETAGAIVPDAVPRVLAHDPALGLFAMDYLDPAAHPVWKAELRDGRVDLAAAQEVGARLGAVHAATAHDPAFARRFANDALFHAIRLEPYLDAAARLHPDLAEPLTDLSRSTLATHVALVHGDVSPKNILLGPRGPIFLDAECAWYGDPAFDLAFCLNHLLLKCLWAPDARARLLEAFDALAGVYLHHVSWEPRSGLEARAARLLPGLLLARVDGKSPVEYLTTEEARDSVRRMARPLIVRPVRTLGRIRTAWAEELQP